MANELVWAGLAGVVVIVLAILFLFSRPSPSQSRVSFDNVLVPSSLLSELNISASLSNNIGIGTASYSVISNINGNLLTLNNKPEVLYMGAEYCPFCAAERWALVIALSRFGTFSNLHFMTSSATDYPPSTPTFTFYNSTYTSNYISFVSVEQTTNQPSGGGYATLQTPNTSEYNLMAQYDSRGSIPFVLFGNKSVLVGATYDPLSVLDSYNWSAVANLLHNGSTVQAQSIIGSANLITTKICQMDNNTPSNVCSQSYVKQIERLS
jgi:thiol-disulfide isomerase/thioredoxin